jgi:TolB-like protein
MPDIFLSYAREDQAVARRFAEGLQRAGYEVWWDQALHPGETFDQVTESALREARAVVVLWSRQSVLSRWVRSEATQADRFGTLVPVMIESCDRPIMFELSHTEELVDWRGEGTDPRWLAFMEHLRRFLDRGGTSSVEQLPVSATLPPPFPSSYTPPRKPPRLPRWMVIAGLLVIAGLGAGTWYLFAHGRAPHSESAASIVVLPFDDGSPDASQAYYANGISEFIRDALERVPGITVAPPSSSIAVKPKAGNPRDVGDTLHVAHMLEGKVSKSGDRVRASVWIVDTRTGKGMQLVQEDRPGTEAIEVQNEIVEKVVSALQVNLGVGVAQQPGMTRDVDAYFAYLEANGLLDQYNADSTRRAIGLLEQATSRDPQFGLAWLQLTGALDALPSQAGLNRQDWQGKMEAAFAHARTVLPDHPLTMYALVRTSVEAGHYKEAAAYFEQALEAVRRCSCFRSEMATQYAFFQLSVGKTRDATETIEQLRASDPLYAYVGFLQALAYAESGNFTASFAVSHKIYPDAGQQQMLVRIGALSHAMGAHNRDEIVHWLDESIDARDPNPTPGLEAMVKAALSDPPAALKRLHAMANAPTVSPIDLMGIANYLMYFGDAPGALAALRTAYGRGETGNVPVILWYPLFRDMRRLPGFRDLVREEGLIDYWRAYGPGDYCSAKDPDWKDFECH